MKAPELILRCMAEQDGDVWVAQCLDLCLAAQGDSLPEAKVKLEAMIEDYIEEAFGPDREHAAYLLRRKAPWSEWAKYYQAVSMGTIGAFGRHHLQCFTEMLPLVPYRHA